MDQDTLNIFYTDDDREDQLMFIDAVNEVSSNVTVTTQANGDDLIRTLSNPPPFAHVIFLDLNMPVKNGYEVLKELKESVTLQHIPVVIFTTSDHSSAIDKTRNLGATLYVPKPLSFSSLKTIIQHILSINWKTFDSKAEDFVYRVN